MKLTDYIATKHEKLQAERLADEFIITLRKRAYGWIASNELEGDYGTWDMWRDALIEFCHLVQSENIAPETHDPTALVKVDGVKQTVVAHYWFTHRDRNRHEERRVTYVEVVE